MLSTASFLGWIQDRPLDPGDRRRSTRAILGKPSSQVRRHCNIKDNFPHREHTEHAVLEVSDMFLIVEALGLTVGSK